ncbi:MAG TPA: cytochrome P450 [Rugosimonospora sp.]|nr:cytochrome P450 [Rugosimonospora sp.]
MSAPPAIPSFPFPVTAGGEPPVEFARLRGECPVARVRLPNGDEAWLVTSYADNRTLLTDPRFSRALTATPGAPRLQPIPPDPDALITMDPPEHTRLRRLVSRAFNTRRVEQLRPRVVAIAGDLVTAMARGGPPADLVSGYALPLPLAVICELLGVPLAERDRFRGLADTVLSLTAHSPEEVGRARAELGRYFVALVAAKRAEPGDDLLSELITVHDEREALTDAELIALARTLLTAGFHTTSNQIALSAVCLLRRPEVVERLRAHPGLMASTVEELLRYNGLSVGGGLIRIAAEEVELGGVTVPKGDAVLPALTSANRDASVFTEPDAFDPDRADNPHMAFGQGMHYCLGAHLARMELSVAFEVLLARLPDVQLAVPAEQLTWTRGRMFHGLAEVAITWS